MLAAQKRAVHVGTAFAEMPVEGSTAIAGPGVWDFNSGLDSEDHKVGQGFRIRCKQSSEFLFGQLRQPRGCG